MLLVLITTLLSLPAHAVPDLSRCGEYQLEGYVRVIDGQMSLSLMDGGQSRIALRMSPELSERSRPFLDRAVKLKARLTKPVQNLEGRIESLDRAAAEALLKDPKAPKGFKMMSKDISSRVADPLRPEKDGKATLLRPENCVSN